MRPYFPEIFNGNDYGKAIDERNTVVRPVDPVKLQSSDPKVISALVLTLNNIKGINIALRRRMGELKIRAKDIREFIMKAYHL